MTTRFLYEGSQVVLEKDSAGNATRNIHGLNLISRGLGAEIKKTINAEHSIGTHAGRENLIWSNGPNTFIENEIVGCHINESEKAGIYIHILMGN